MQPPSETPTSAALLDCFAVGLAVPCVFDEYLYDMLPFADVLPYRAMMVFVPPEDAKSPQATFLDHLRAYSVDERVAMLRGMQSVSQALQYAVCPVVCEVKRAMSPPGLGHLRPCSAGERMAMLHSMHSVLHALQYRGVTHCACQLLAKMKRLNLWKLVIKLDTLSHSASQSLSTNCTPMDLNALPSLII